jgi:lysophospholipase L1-like esterase
MKVKSIFQNVGLSIFSLIIFLLLLEVLLRFGISIFSDRVTRTDPRLGWYHEPNASRTDELEGHAFKLGYNSHGFRLPEHNYKKTKGVYRIVILGDSFVDGSEVGDQETFTWHLQQSVDSLEVINLGVYGFSTAQQLICLERVGLKYNPDLAILVTMTNDYTDNLLNSSLFGPRPRFVLKDDSLIFEGTDHPAAQQVFRQINLPIPGRKFFHRHSYLYYFINHYIYQRLSSQQIQALINQQKSAENEMGQRELYYRLVERVKETCERAGADFWVVFAYPKKYLQENHQSPSREIASELEKRGIKVLDLFHPLKKEEFSSENSLYYVEDFHWNPRGHQFVASVLKESLESRFRRSGE